ncbi:MAG: hypothetical protein AAB913_03370 [Patescibacteria group bacterium]
MKKNIYYILIFFLAFVAIFYFYKTSVPEIGSARAKCPEDYAETDAGDIERLAAIDKWTNEFYDKNPGASLVAWSEARRDFWVDNNCVETLRKYDEAKSGTADPVKMKLIEDTIKETIEEHNNNLPN